MQYNSLGKKKMKNNTIAMKDGDDSKWANWCNEGKTTKLMQYNFFRIKEDEKK